jgi:hypothetical protein
VFYFLFHGDAAAKVEKHRRLDGVDQVTQRLLLCSKTSYAASGIYYAGNSKNQPPIGWLKKCKINNKTLLYGTVTYITALFLHIVAM